MTTCQMCPRAVRIIMAAHAVERPGSMAAGGSLLGKSAPSLRMAVSNDVACLLGVAVCGGVGEVVGAGWRFVVDLSAERRAVKNCCGSTDIPPSFWVQHSTVSCPGLTVSDRFVMT